MTRNSSDAIILQIPRMHPGVLPKDLPSGVLSFDPGLAQTDEGHWRPADLPLDGAKARRYLADTLQFGAMFKKPGDLAYYSVHGLEDFYSGTALDSATEFRDLAGLIEQGGEGAAEPLSEAAKAEEAEQERREVLSRGQMTLILAWAVEERAAELDQARQGVDSNWKNLGNVLGMEAEDVEARELGLGSFDPGQERADEPLALPLPAVFRFMAPFLPENVVLFATLSSLPDSVLEQADFSPVASEDLAALGLDGEGLAGTLEKGEAPGYALAGKSKGADQPEWLARTYSLLVWNPEA